MSYGQNGMNGYTNGHRNQQPPTRYEDGYREGGPVGGRRSRRAGGYGGFGNEEPEQRSNGHPATFLSPESPDPYNAPPIPSWRRTPVVEEFASRDRGGPLLNTGTSGDGPGARQIGGVLQHINEKWSVITKDDCVPVHIALQLMDYSSLGRGNDYEDFKQTSQALQKALKTIVNEHHQGFNSSIGTFHKIQSSIQVSQDRMRTLRTSLIDAKANLTVAKPELRGLATTSQNYEEMLQVLGQIEKTQAIPEQLDARISDKHFLTAVDVLQDALRLIRNLSLENIGALADLRVYLSNQENSLTDILLEELHDHLYLKSPYCQSRWKPYSANTSNALEPEKSISNMSTGIRPLYRFLTGLNVSIPVADDTSHNPEEDSFDYIHIVLEALNKMGRLEMAVDRMEQRLPIELFSVVEKTNQEVDYRNPAHLRAAQTGTRITPAIELKRSEGSDTVLNDLLYTLYSKFEAIAEGHRAVHEVIAGIIEREGIRKTGNLMSGFKELWKLFQSEMRSLLHDYLATDGSNTLYTSRDASGANVNIFHRNPRDKLKRVFKLGEMDKKSAILANEQEELDKILQTSVPGLASKSYRRSGIITGDRNVNYETPATGHKLLIEPSVFNIGVLLPPSLSFLHRLKDILPPDSDIAVSTLTSFLDDFLVNVFNPQLEETVTELCAQSFIDIDAFQEDPRWADAARIPVFKGASHFVSLIKAFCKMLDNIPQDQAFTKLIINQLATFYDKCMAWYKSLVLRTTPEGPSRPKLAASMLEKGDLVGVVHNIWDGDEVDRRRLMQKEVELIISQTNDDPIDPLEIITDRRSGTALCLLYSSLQWLANQLEELRLVIKKGASSDRESKRGEQSSRWNTVSTASMRDDDQPTKLPMTEETLGQFDNVVLAFRELALTALFTLHVDIRYGIIYMMSQIFEAHYVLGRPSNEPDASILSFNTDLLNFDDTMTSHLPPKEHHFVASGLGLLLDSFLVTNASRIRSMNGNGCGRMQLNILVLQQNLKSVEKDVMLTRSAQFFDYFQQGPKAVVKKAKETGGKDMGLNLEEIKVLIELCYSEALQSSQRDIAAQAKRSMGDDMLQLTEYMWST